ncbi:MAG: hypothetical protein ACREJC_17535 [Tepidisphaeraceae bacterium]
MSVLDYESALARSTTRGNWFSWAVFLGMSWTWCIGMFLPVLLVRDYGTWGWIAFAVPNVVGAAAMGFVLRQAASSNAIVLAHARTCCWFSLLTIAFHVFFAAWLNRLYPGLIVVAAGTAVAVYCVCRVQTAGDRLGAAGVAAISLVCMGLFVLRRRASAFTFEFPRVEVQPLLVLACAMWFGFLFCPYLDLTFHRARQSTTPSGSRLAFAVGFGVVFLSMITFSLLYAGDVSGIGRFVPRGSHEPNRGLPWSTLVAIHLAVQSGFTVATHARELVATETFSLPNRRFQVALLMSAAALLGIVAMNWPQALRSVSFLSSGELVYRVFLGFYGLIFPAYVWLCMIPSRGRVPPNRRGLMIFAASVLVAAPCFWLGFIEQKTIWLIPGLLIVLLARLGVPRRSEHQANL